MRVLAARVSIDAATAASKDVVLSIQWYLSQRKVRSDLVEALLDAVAITPKGHPSPADILAATISGLHEGGSAITAHVATLDVTETGTCVVMGGQRREMLVWVEVLPV